MMNNLETLLNALIEKWRNPRGEPNWVEYIKWIVAREIEWWDKIQIYWSDSWMVGKFSLNDLCSLESWLRQFVIKKKLYKKEKWFLSDWERKVECNALFYWIMYSSIQNNKSEFLIDNIKIDD